MGKLFIAMSFQLSCHNFSRTDYFQENDFNDSVTNPCLPKGFNSLPFNASDLFNHSCTSDIIPDSEDYDYNAATLITFEGTSDPDQCYDLMEKALNFSKCFVNRTTAVDCSNDRVPNVTAKNFLVILDQCSFMT